MTDGNENSLFVLHQVAIDWCSTKLTRKLKLRCINGRINGTAGQGSASQ